MADAEAFATLLPRFAVYATALFSGLLVLVLPNAIPEGVFLLFIMLAGFFVARAVPLRGSITALILVAFFVVGFTLLTTGTSFFSVHIKTLLTEYALTAIFTLLFYNAQKELYSSRTSLYGP